MPRKRKNDFPNENWVKLRHSKERQRDFKALAEVKAYEKGKTFEYVPHPTSPRCKIRVEIKN